jgi:transcriptional regulator NrdR family protein
MKCPACKADSKVIDSRDVADGAARYRRRECLNKKCNHRWTTQEVEVSLEHLKMPLEQRIRVLNLLEKIRYPMESAIKEMAALTAEIKP